MKVNTRRTISFYWKHVKKFKLPLAVMLITAIIAASADLIAPYFYKLIFDVIAEEGVKSEIAKKAVIYLLIAFGFLFINWLMWRISDYFNRRFQSEAMGSMANECFEVMHKHSYNFFTSNFTGSLVKKVNRLVRSFEGIFDRLYFDLLILIVNVSIIFAVLFYIQPILGIVMAIWTSLFIFFNLLFVRYKWKFDILKARADTKTTAQLADTITNAITIKLFAGFKHEIKKFAEIIKSWVKKTQKAWLVDEYARSAQHFAMIFLNLIIFFIAIKLWEQGALTIGDFVWIQAYLFGLFEKIWGFGRVMRDLYRDLADAEEMVEILNTKYEIEDPENAKNISVVRGKIEFQKVKFSYDKSKKVIKNLNLYIKPGEKVALVGPSGGGKSTVAKLILRFFDIQRGKILVDGQNIKTVTQNSLRSQISLVPQDPILFHRTLKENIRYGCRNATDEQVIAASKLAHCHEFIQKFPEKYETYVGERGVKLSGGERQRVAIARAILANNPITILDEATSSLDSYSESKIQEALKNLMKYKTTLIIAHRLSTIMSADRILVFKDGKIVESGTHNALIKKEKGLYKKLWHLQSGGYLNS
jgi:ATP-binding cassette subfamily B protein